MTARFLEGKVVWVTGGASGMGRAMALVTIWESMKDHTGFPKRQTRRPSNRG